ncbi:MAG: hypothetical protein U1E25_15700 [Methylocystis sp.]
MLELGCLTSYANTLERRRQNQSQYPEDKSNSRAAAILDSMEPQIAALNGSPLHQRLFKFREAQGLSCGERDIFSEIVSDELHAVGFTLFPATAGELLEVILKRLEELSHFEEEAQASKGHSTSGVGTIPSGRGATRSFQAPHEEACSENHK